MSGHTPEAVRETSGRPELADLSVVVPAYNEEARLGPTLTAVIAYLDANEGRWGAWELIIADDGSTDGTRDVVTALAHPRVQLVVAPRNRGKGHALRLGVAASHGRRVLVTDADLAAPIEELERLDKAIGEGHSAAIGSRAVPGADIAAHQHRLRELFGRAGNLLIRTAAVPGIRDTHCGFKLFDGDRARDVADPRIEHLVAQPQLDDRAAALGRPAARRHIVGRGRLDDAGGEREEQARRRALLIDAIDVAGRDRPAAGAAASASPDAASGR